jgi:hypothetical protein
MPVTASAGDAAGAAIDAKITALAAYVTATASSMVAASAVRMLDQARREAVEHYLAKGRIDAATILSTLS